MRVGIFCDQGRDLDRVREQAAAAAGDGFASFWLPQVWHVEALTALAVVGHDVGAIELGTAVVPIQPRHPQTLAAQALTVQAATDGRLALGLGLSHQIVVEQTWGLPWDRPVRRMREYLEALLPMLDGEAVAVQRETVTSVGGIDVHDVTRPPVLLAALGPQTLKLAGTVADGTITWCTGVRTLAELTVPTITDAAAAAGRGEPRVVAMLPVCLCDDTRAAHEHIARQFSVYGSLPSYRRMLDHEGVEGPADIAIVGDEDRAFALVDDLRCAGVTDLVAAEVPRDDDERERTRAFLRSLL